jgi:hypothetical protein
MSTLALILHKIRVNYVSSTCQIVFEQIYSQNCSNISFQDTWKQILIQILVFKKNH